MVCLKQHTYILESCKQSSMPQSLIKEEIKKEAFPQQAGELHTAEADGTRLIVWG